MAGSQFWTALARSIRFGKMRPVSVNRNLVLDGLRGMAVILVIFHHLKLINKDAFQFPLFKVGRYVLTPLVRGGWIGVDLFFVLSGFLVSGLLFYEYKKTSAINPARFLVRRAFKIYPLFIIFLFTTFLLEKMYSYYYPETSYPVLDYVKDLLFIENYTGGRFAHTWSLDVEEFFYLILTLFFVISVRKRMVNLKRFRRAFILLLLLCITGRVISICISAGDDSFYLKTHTRLDAMFFGVLLSYLYHFEKSRLDPIRKHAAILTLGCLLFLLPNFFFGWTNTYLLVVTLSSNYICFGVLLVIALDKAPRLIQNRFLVFIGQHSYAIYLWHVFINIYALRFILSTEWGAPNGTISSISFWLLYIASYISLSIGVGVLFTKVVETPFLKLRDRIFPSMDSKRALVENSKETLNDPIQGTISITSGISNETFNTA